ncbi:MAG TPA: hypothetical protein VM656_15235 [Pyrinomonadaceae bacterium]|jgi:hypothetical protein|nr:hypothetical protein [Pyrinomonadaceae bacterium]
MKTKILVTLMVIALISVATWRSQGQPKELASTCYEYQVLDDPTETGPMDDGMKKLNDLGAQGWELASVSRAPSKPTKLYLKRIKK